jgi:hypothetical protein
MKKLRVISKKTGLKISEIIRGMIEEGLKNIGKKGGELNGSFSPMPLSQEAISKEQSLLFLRSRFGQIETIQQSELLGRLSSPGRQTEIWEDDGRECEFNRIRERR